MQLTPAQLAQYDRDGFLIFPGLFEEGEIGALREEIVRLGQVDDPAIQREHSGSIKSIYRVHETDGATSSPVFRAASRARRLVRPAMQVLGDDQIYIYHSKCNIKTAIDGTVWLWHQDYGNWQHDGVPGSNMVTALIMLEEATELGGCLYFIPGSHKGGVQPALRDEKITAYKLWAIEKERMRTLLRESPQPVPIVGKPGTVAIFHANILHASGHNLSAVDRWHIYFAYNPVANHPRTVPNPRPEFFVSRDYTPVEIAPEGPITAEFALS